MVIINKLYTARNTEISMSFITSAHRAHKLFLKPSQLPGEYSGSVAAILAHIGL